MDKKLEPLRTEARQLFQKLSNGQRCMYSGEPATETHHIVNKDQAEVLRYNYLNAYYVNHKYHNQSSNNSVERFNEWNIPGVAPWVKFTLNKFKGILLKDYLILADQSEEEHLQDMIAEMKAILKSRENKY